MPLILRIHSYRNQPVPALAPVAFGEAGGTVGRSVENALVLDDPSKYISRTHAKVSLREGSFYYEDLGSNPSVINDRPLGKGREIALGQGDRIVVGDYQLEALISAAQVAAPIIPPAPLNNPALPLFEPPAPMATLPPPAFVPPVPVAPAPAAVAPASPPDALAGARLLDVGGDSGNQADPLGLNLFAGGAAASPMAGLGSHNLNPPAALRATESDHVSPERAAFTLPAAAAGASAIPADYDPLADLLAPAAAPQRGFDDPLATQSLPPLTQPFASPAQPAVAAAVGHPQPFAAPPGAAAASLPAGVGGGDSQILQALLRGLGLPDLKLEGSGVEVAESIGAMLREATAGTMDVLMARALTKKESRMDMTMMAVRSNNPLKFFPNVDSALAQLLGNTMAGYMPPVQSMVSAFDDLRSHELSVIAGMRAALTALLERLDPEAIEQRTAPATMIDKMNGSNARKAKMWEQMVEVYAQVAADVDEAQGMFGDSFSSAYEEQVERLRRGK